MTSLSIGGKSKSMKWIQTDWSENSTTPTSTVAEDKVENLHLMSFENILPEICIKFGCPVQVIVQKEIAKDEEKPAKRVTSTKEHQTQTTPISKRGKTPTKSVAQHQSEHEAIVVTARYTKSNHLTEIEINKTNLFYRQVIQVISLLAPYYGLFTKIAIKRCRLGVFVLPDLGKMLPLTAITDICLDESTLPEGNFAVLLDGTKLKHLSLARCLINDVVCEQIALKLHHTMPAEKHLMTLNLSSNHITDIGAKYIANALRSNRRLKYLNLANNRITDEGFCNILNMLAEFPLTYDEMIHKRECYYEFLKGRAALAQLLINNIDSPKLQSQTSLKNNFVISPKTGKKKKVKHAPNTDSFVFEKRENSHKKRSESKSMVNIVEADSEERKNELLSKQIMGAYVTCIGPFTPDTVVEESGWAYCVGNMELCYLNVSYNNISYLSLKKLLNILVYQNEVKQETETGLIKVGLEGNPLPESYTELDLINNIFNKNLATSRITRVEGRRKSIALNIPTLNEKSDVTKQNMFKNK